MNPYNKVPPVILTSFKEAYNIVKDGFNGYIIPLNSEEYDSSLVDKIFNSAKPEIRIQDRFDMSLAKEIFDVIE